MSVIPPDGQLEVALWAETVFTVMIMYGNNKHKGNHNKAL